MKRGRSSGPRPAAPVNKKRKQKRDDDDANDEPVVADPTVVKYSEQFEKVIKDATTRLDDLDAAIALAEAAVPKGHISAKVLDSTSFVAAEAVLASSSSLAALAYCSRKSLGRRIDGHEVVDSLLDTRLMSERFRALRAAVHPLTAGAGETSASAAVAPDLTAVLPAKPTEPEKPKGKKTVEGVDPKAKGKGKAAPVVPSSDDEEGSDEEDWEDADSDGSEDLPPQKAGKMSLREIRAVAALAKLEALTSKASAGKKDKKASMADAEAEFGDGNDVRVRTGGEDDAEGDFDDMSDGTDPAMMELEALADELLLAEGLTGDFDDEEAIAMLGSM